MSWQPIETAPKDGTKLLLSDGEEIWMVQWQDYIGAFAESGTDAPSLSAERLSDATHWMPLPMPPDNVDREGNVYTITDPKKATVKFEKGGYP